MRYQKNLTHLKTLPSGADVGFADQCQTSTKICVAKEGLSWHRIGYFQLYASSRHIRSMYKSWSNIQAKEISFWPFCMQSFRKAAYRQFALCRHGKFGRGNRRVMPSCVVLQIRHTYWFALSTLLFIFWIFNSLSADTSTLRDANKKIEHVTDATIRLPFVKSARNKFQVRETLVVINLQAKVARSHIGANHLLCSKKRRDGGSRDSSF